MKETPKCAGCSYMGWPVPRRITGNNRHLDGPRSSCMCRHPEAVASFRRVCPKSPRLEAFIGFTKPGGKRLSSKPHRAGALCARETEATSGRASRG